jgi:hypothetical protein
MPRFTIAELAAVFDDGTTLMDILESHRWATAERARSRRKASRRRALGRPVAPVDGKAAFEAACQAAWGALPVADASGAKVDASGAAK